MTPVAVEATAQIPAIFYYVVGILILSNLGAIVSLLVFIFKAGMFVAQTKAGIKDAKDCAVRAHTSIDKIEAKLSE